MGKELLNAMWEVDTSALLGEGTYGVVYAGSNIFTGERVAVKYGRSDSGSALCHEFHVYRQLRQGPSIPKVQRCLHHRGVACIVMELLGPSLAQLMKKRRPRLRLWPFFSLKEVINIGCQMISALEFLHSRSFIHGDIKPGNILRGANEKDDRYYLIDYGLAEQYRNPDTQRHNAQSKAGMYGTLCFASINSHLGRSLSRRDDMESLGYVLVYLLRGTLPWRQTASIGDCGQTQSIYEQKATITLEELCGDPHDPLYKFMQSIRSLSFYDTPNYLALCRGLRELDDHRSDLYLSG